jgi:hypothetical protein
MNIAVSVFRPTPVGAQSSAELTLLQTIDNDIKAGTLSTDRALSQIVASLNKPQAQAQSQGTVQSGGGQCPSGMIPNGSGVCIHTSGPNAGQP